MKLIAITSERFLNSEADIICRLLDAGFCRVHLRKPGADANDIRRLLDAIPPDRYPCLSLHDRHSLASEYSLGGIHLNSRNPFPPSGFTALISRSCHSIDEAATASYDYCFLSPVFDSISKHGYKSSFNPSQLRQALYDRLCGRRVYALGGVSLSNLDNVASLGFKGAAMLGQIWGSGDYKEILRNIYDISKWINCNI